jgi:hypothetical protein
MSSHGRKDDAKQEPVVNTRREFLQLGWFSLADDGAHMPDLARSWRPRENWYFCFNPDSAQPLPSLDQPGRKG